MTSEVFANNERAQQYELSIDGQVAALAQYRRHGDTLALVHTEVLPGHEGKGLGSRLARQVFEDLRAHGQRAQLKCEFMAGYAKKHPEYAHVIAAGGNG